MKYFLIAGERSGDMHASKLISGLKTHDPNASFYGMGGEMMEAAGAKLEIIYGDLAFMGFWEVLTNYSTIKKAFKRLEKAILTIKPDVVILIDYGGFNMRMAKFAKKHNLKVFYYISPKIWAWNTGRARKIKELVDRMFVILPFEKEFYKQFDYEVDYVGNPVLDEIANFRANPDFKEEHRLDERPIIAVLPGSRKDEIEATLYRMLSVLPAFPDYQFVVAAVSNQPDEYYKHFTRNGRVTIVYNQTYDLLHNAFAALVTSGTATLETALFKVPQVVCYSVSTPTYWIAKALIKVPYVSLVNLIAGAEIVKELLQDDFIPAHIREELKRITEDAEHRAKVLKDYEDLDQKMGFPGASLKTADLMAGYLGLM